ncbi:T9SS type A sorting domain-containing protein [Lentimicrobium sp. S6]|uniref:T9SS type A sorting domain-containing protein n=1 Tax=Lentimicrobium sp. S6 TaxID=2735872 RepID=UPI0015532E28|nr:T9SS type A sorting domain-containing protein [Lentimicrobium sp. S6]NPD45643.1 Omp28-related outer membrane protein [Lentimicrobium sp. S6]
MKKRNLLLFSLSCLMFFGLTTMVNAQCDLVIDMQDSYGDGWNGASVKVYDGSTLLGTATIANGFSGSATISAPDMADISLVWTAGSYPEECSFTVTNGIGIDVYVCELLGSPAPGEFFVFTNVCSSVGLDVNLIDFIIAPKVAAGDLEITGIVRSERDTPITSFDVVYSLDGVSSSVYTFEDLDISFNTTFEFTHPELAQIEVGDHTIELTVENINGEGADDDPNNNTLSAQVLCVNEIFAKNVVYEEGTGTWCGWCPRGLVGLNTMAHDYTDGSWIGIGVHNGDPMTVTEYDNGVGQFIGGYPSGVMNRENVFDPGLSSLEPAYLAAKQEIPLAKIQVTAKTWDEGSREITVDATSNFAMDLTGTSYNVSMVIVESGITGTGSSWNQANYYSGGGNGDLIDWDGTNWAELSNPVPAADMVYQHVGRVLVGGWDGIPNIIPADVVYGTPYTHVFTYTLDDEFDPAQVDLVVMLIDATTGVIANAAEVALEGGEILSPAFSADVVNGLAPLEVNFTDETVGTVATWSWDFDMDGTEDSNEQNPTFIFEGGDFDVSLTVTNEAGEGFTTVMENFIHSSGVGVNEIAESTFKLYPNPASDVINIQSVNALTSIKIWSISGQIVYTNEDSSNLQTIDVSSFKKGVFFMELSTETETQIIKIAID